MSTLNAFLVEDSPLLRASLVDTLEELAPVKFLGTAEDEAGAVAWLAEHQEQCDVLIVDIFLKGGSGLGVLRAAKDLGAETRLVVLSNYATADIRKGCAKLGADRVFDKSSEIDELIGYCVRLSD